MMGIPKESKLYRKEDYYLCSPEDGHSTGIPAFKSQLKQQRQQSTQINEVLRNLIKQRLIGCLMNEHIPLKSEDRRSSRALKTQRVSNTVLLPRDNRRCQNHERERSIQGDRREEYHGGFISSIDMSRQGSVLSKRTLKNSAQRNMILLPPVKKQVANVNRDGIWKKISSQNKLKKQLFVKVLSKEYGQHICNNIIRFFQLTFELFFFKYNVWIETVSKCNNEIKKFIMFQIYDIDGDGVISCDDLFELIHIIEDATQKELIEEQIYKLKQIVLEEGKSPGIYKGQSLMEYLSLNKNITLSEIYIILDEQHRPYIQSNIKKFTGYEHTFLVTQHNEEIRLFKQRAEDIKMNMQKSIHRKRAGITFDAFINTNDPVFESVLSFLSN